MPVVTTAENPLMALLVQRCPALHRPYPDIAAYVSEYGRIPPGVEAPHLAEALAAQPAGTGRADRAFELGLDTMLGLILERGATG